MTHGIRKLKNDRKGGIEGLPLELMIIIIVATMGAAILVGWMGNIETPESIGDISVEPKNINLAGDGTTSKELTITVTDQDGNGIQGATVVLTGLNISNGGVANSHDAAYPTGTVAGTTDNAGSVGFKNLKMNLRGSLGYITVTASMPDYGEKSVKIPVVHGGTVNPSEQT